MYIFPIEKETIFLLFIKIKENDIFTSTDTSNLLHKYWAHLSSNSIPKTKELVWKIRAVLLYTKSQAETKIINVIIV